MDKEQDHRTPITRRKAFFFSITPALVLLFLAAVLELGLRVFGDSSFAHLVNPYSYDGMQWLRVNRSYLGKYFPASSPLIPEFKPTIVHAEKDSGEFRLLCLGESSMFGTPYQYGATIPAILQKQLRHLSPTREITVINLGASAINTNVIADIVPQTLELKPDAVLIYTGHNEFYGPDGVGASWLERTLPFLVPVKYALRDLRIVHAIQQWLRAASMSENRGAEQNMMRQVSEGAHVRAGSSEERRILGIFDRNLHRILEFYRQARIPVIVSDVASNLLFPPFVSDSCASPDSIRQALQPTGSPRMLQSLLHVRSTDTACALLDFSIGTLLLRGGDSSRALPYFEKARDEDLLKFRAPSVINTTIRAVCEETGTPCISAVRTFDSLSPGHIPGYNFFWEHLHPRPTGYYQIADLFLKELLTLRILPSANPDSMFSQRLPCDPHQLSISWLDLALGDLSVQALTGRWPFEHFKTGTLSFDGADTALQHIALEVYANRLGWNEGNLRTAEWFIAHGEMIEARTSYEAILEEYPRAYAVRYLLANLLRNQGLIAPAERQYRMIIQTDANYPFARVELGLLLINDGALTEAQRQLTVALALADRGITLTNSLRASAYYGLSAIAANRGDFGEALRLVDESLHLDPSYGAAAALRQRILQASKH